MDFCGSSFFSSAKCANKRVVEVVNVHTGRPQPCMIGEHSELVLCLVRGTLDDMELERLLAQIPQTTAILEFS